MPDVTLAQQNAQAVSGRWALAVHGGAGGLAPEMDRQQRELLEQSLRRALGAGKQILERGGSALVAVEAAVVILEDDPQFNAGRGAVFTRSGTHELDASIIDGATLQAGGVAGIQFQRNPIKAARLVMEHTPHVLMAGAGADAVAREHGLEPVDPVYFYSELRFVQLNKALAKLGQMPLDKPAYPLQPKGSTSGAVEDGPDGTVGCVALDSRGNLAAATSTGGVTGKLPGRIGDSAICGAGTYANNVTCAVSCTGKGEQFIRYSIAARISMLVEERQLTIDKAVGYCLSEVLEQGDGGIIAVDRNGRVSLRATTAAMPRGFADSEGRFETAIEVQD